MVNPVAQIPKKKAPKARARARRNPDQLSLGVCRRFGLEVRSVDYLKNHASAENLLAISKRMIVEATNRIEARS